MKKTEKRLTKNFRLEDFIKLCQNQDRKFRGSEQRSKEMLEVRASALETKILNILERIAPMKVQTLEYRGKPSWISKELEARTKERMIASKKARRSRLKGV